MACRKRYKHISTCKKLSYDSKMVFRRKLPKNLGRAHYNFVMCSHLWSCTVSCLRRVFDSFSFMKVCCVVSKAQNVFIYNQEYQVTVTWLWCQCTRNKLWDCYLVWGVAVWGWHLRSALIITSRSKLLLMNTQV